jgi:hypothetical protein
MFHLSDFLLLQALEFYSQTKKDFAKSHWLFLYFLIILGRRERNNVSFHPFEDLVVGFCIAASGWAQKKRSRCSRQTDSRSRLSALTIRLFGDTLRTGRALFYQVKATDALCRCSRAIGALA